MKKYIQWGIIGFELVLIVSLITGIKQSRQTSNRVESLVEEKMKLIEKREQLLQRLEYVQGDDYLETVAREELNLAQPGEVVVIVPEDRNQLSVASKQEEERIQENWKKWLGVLSGKIQ